MALWLLLQAGEAVAGPADFAPENTGWQGTARLWEMARHVGFGVEVASRIEWASLGRRDILFVIYPTRPLPLDKVVRWLRAGGRLILADDYGTSDLLLARLGVKRFYPDGQTLPRLYAENPNLPIATPGAPHPLNERIGQLITNHPAAFETSLPAVFRFGPRGGAVVVAATLGRGRLVLLSDPSVLINRMLRFPGNEAFARRLLTYLGDPGADRYVVVTQAFDEVGVPKAATQVRVPREDPLSVVLGDANKLLAEFNDYVLDPVWILPLATILAGILLILLAGAIPMVRPVYDARWTRPGRSLPPPPFERDLRPYLDRAPQRMNFIHPAAVLRDGIDIRLERRLGVTAPLTTLDEPALCRMLRDRAGPEAETLCRQILRQCRRIPPRAQVAPHSITPRLSYPELERLWQAAESLMHLLDPPIPLPGVPATEAVAPDNHPDSPASSTAAPEASANSPKRGGHDVQRQHP